jgi:hypothetical protein
MHHVIVKSEAAIRAENERMKLEIQRLRADCNRLRALAGEPVLEDAKVHASAIADIQQFTAGECRVSIVGKPGVPGRAPSNPAAAVARAQVGAAPLRFNMQTKEASTPAAQLAQLAPPIPAGSARPTTTNTEGVELDDLEQRVALLELK